MPDYKIYVSYNKQGTQKIRCITSKVHNKQNAWKVLQACSSIDTNFKAACYLFSFLARSCDSLAPTRSYLDFPYTIASFHNFFAWDVSFAHYLESITCCYFPGKASFGTLRKLNSKWFLQHVIRSHLNSFLRF